jgi:molybdate transport system substrate-binding protein
MDALEKEKLIVPGTRVELARAVLGVAVKDGAPVPDISTPEKIKARLLSARAIAWIDPKIGGQAGTAIIAVLNQLNVTDEVMKKSVYGKTGAESVQKMVAGEADIVISFTSEILPIKGAKLVGALPASMQGPASFAGAVAVGAPNPDQARALLRAMTMPDARAVMVKAGLEPITR